MSVKSVGKQGIHLCLAPPLTASLSINEEGDTKAGQHGRDYGKKIILPDSTKNYKTMCILVEYVASLSSQKR